MMGRRDRNIRFDGRMRSALRCGANGRIARLGYKALRVQGSGRGINGFVGELVDERQSFTIIFGGSSSVRGRLTEAGGYFAGAKVE
jgi:hypothetical protein